MQILQDDCHATTEVGWFALRWRAEHLGPGAVAHDRHRAERGGWARRYWDKSGNLRPREEVAEGLWASMRGTARSAVGLPALAPDEE